MGRTQATLRRLIPASRYARAVTMLASGAALGQAAIVLSAPLLTRIFLPQDFGVFAVYAAVVSVLALMSAFRYDLALTLPKNNAFAVNTLAICLVSLVATTLATGVGVWGLGERLTVWTNAPSLKPYLWYLPIGVFFAGGFQILTYWTIRQRRYRVLARTRVLKNAATVATQIGVGAITAGPLGLLLGHAVGEGSGVGLLALPSWENVRNGCRRVSRRRLLAALRRYRRFPCYSCPSSVINQAGLRAPELLLAALFGPGVAGPYLLSRRVTGTPTALIGVAVSQAYLAEASARIRERKGDPRRMFSKLAVRLFAIGLVPAVVLAWVGPQLAVHVFGEPWYAAGLYVRYMAPSLLAHFVVSPLSQTLNILERQDLQLTFDVLRFATAVVCFFGASWMGWEPGRAILAFSLSNVALYALLYWLTYSALDKYAIGLAGSTDALCVSREQPCS